LGPLDLKSILEVATIVRGPEPTEDETLDAQALRLPQDREYVSREEYAGKYGAQAADIDRVVRYTNDHGLKTLSVDAGAREIRVRGTAAQFIQAFSITLLEYEQIGAAARHFHSYEGPIFIPADLEGIVQAVVGLDDRPVARARDPRRAVE
jgi:kumamolisin